MNLDDLLAVLPPHAHIKREFLQARASWTTPAGLWAIGHVAPFVLGSHSVTIAGPRVQMTLTNPALPEVLEILRRYGAVESPGLDVDSQMSELVLDAWTLIASSRDWDDKRQDWVDAAIRWRDQFHKWVGLTGGPQVDSPTEASTEDTSPDLEPEISVPWESRPDHANDTVHISRSERGGEYFVVSAATYMNIEGLRELGDACHAIAKLPVPEALPPRESNRPRRQTACTDGA